jgi:hypothetical protein
MMRGFVSRRFGPWRAGVSFPLSAPRPHNVVRARPKALASVTHTRPSRFYYGVSLDEPDPTAELPHEHQSVGRSLWSIVSSLAYLALVGVEVAAFVAIVLVAGLVLIMRL